MNITPPAMNVRMKTLSELILAHSKHSDYQTLHPSILRLMPDLPQPAGRHEHAREMYMKRHLSVESMRVLDIGANTGYFSFYCIDAGAKQVVSQEGNQEHANFIRTAASSMGLAHKLEVRSVYYEFDERAPDQFDLVLCLNVLHHLGDDFGGLQLNIIEAKSRILAALNSLAEVSTLCWFQLGFNWKGDRNLPLFEHGTKRELIDFVRQGTEGHWHIERIAAADPHSRDYENLSDQNMPRADELGEFLNRPLFLLRSTRIS
jgi:SAM-dependent methyltransferase